MTGQLGASTRIFRGRAVFPQSVKSQGILMLDAEVAVGGWELGPERLTKHSVACSKCSGDGGIHGRMKFLDGTPHRGE